MSENESLNAWGMHCTVELARHIGESVNGLMPDGLHVVAAGLQVLIEKTPPGGAPRAVSTFDVRPPIDFTATPLATVAHHVLDDIADEVTTYLHQPWPTNADGVALHAWADDAGDSIALAFRGTGVNADAVTIELPAYTPPPKPDHSINAG